MQEVEIFSFVHSSYLFSSACACAAENYNPFFFLLLCMYVVRIVQFLGGCGCIGGELHDAAGGKSLSGVGAETGEMEGARCRHGKLARARE